MARRISKPEQDVAKDRLGEALRNSNRVELGYARSIVANALRLDPADVDGMLVSHLLRALGWRRLHHPATRGAAAAYGRNA